VGIWYRHSNYANEHAYLHSSFGDWYSLLLHSFMNSHLIFWVHFVKLINTANSLTQVNKKALSPLRCEPGVSSFWLVGLVFLFQLFGKRTCGYKQHSRMLFLLLNQQCQKHKKTQDNDIQIVHVQHLLCNRKLKTMVTKLALILLCNYFIKIQKQFGIILY